MKRGDVVLFDFPFSDGTGSKLRPAIVVQADAFNQSIDDTILVLVTRTRRSLATEVVIDPSTPEGQSSKLRHTSVADCKNILTADQRFIHRVVGRLSDPLMQQVDAALRTALDL